MKKFCLYFYLLISFIFLHGTTYTVDDDGSADFNTIQEAVDSAKSGDTVFVFNGIYNECISVGYKTNLSLIGENVDSCIIKSDGSSGCVISLMSREVLISVNSDTCFGIIRTV